MNSKSKYLTSYQAPLRTTPYKKTHSPQYDSDYIRRKAKDYLDEIWDALGIPATYLQGKCPLCNHDRSFQIIDTTEGIFHCIHCNAQGDGIHLLQRYHQWDLEETVERIGRNLRL